MFDCGLDIITVTGFWWGRVVKSHNSTNKQKLEF